MKSYAFPDLMHSFSHLAEQLPFTRAASFSVNPNPVAFTCFASYSEMAFEHDARHAGTQAGSISSVLVMLPVTTRSVHTLDLAAGAEVYENEPVDLAASTTAALVAPPGAMLPPSPGTRNRCSRSEMTSTHASAVKPFFRPTI
jgi:hypothetical protein